tara:strand:+ start:989 stop:2224 length:1236 start_codon:yes stop_codon:yes gene_type:complete
MTDSPPSSTWLYILKQQEMETLQPMQVRRVNIPTHRTNTIQQFINNNSEDNNNSDNCWLEIDPPELPDKLRNIKPKSIRTIIASNRNNKGDGVSNSNISKKRSLEDNAASATTNNNAKKQKLLLVHKWKDSIDNIILKLSNQQERGNGANVNNTSKVENIVEIIQEAASQSISQKNMKSICKMLQVHFGENDVEILNFFISLSDKIGGTNYNTIVNTIMYPRAISLKRTASRSFMNAINEIHKNGSRALLTGIMIPLITINIKNDNTNREGSLHMNSRSPQIELLTRILKITTPSTALLFLSASLTEVDQQKHNKKMLPWNEFTFPLLKTLISKPFDLNNDSNSNMCKKLIDKIEKHSKEFSKSLKFVSVINALIVKHKEVAKVYKISLERALANTNTFLSKTTLKLLNKL